MRPFVRFRSLLLVATTFALLFAGGAAAVRGQSALDGFDPHANNVVRVIVVQPDGKILIGGDFTMLSPNGGVAVTRNHIARLNPDGTLDTDFDPNATNTVSAIAVQADGKILIGGGFTFVLNFLTARNDIARFNKDDTLDMAFDPDASANNHVVRAFAVQSDGKILAVGDFTIMSGQTRNHIARLDATTGLAIRSTPTRTTILSFQSRCRRPARF